MTSPVGPQDARATRIAERQRAPKWKLPPFTILVDECINCDACLAACPPRLGAVFHHGPHMVIVPELCSGCGKCLAPVCPVDCIVADESWTPTSDETWSRAEPGVDPYRDESGELRHAADLTNVRRW